MFYIAKRLVAGNINVNGVTGPVVELPFGGFKEFGFGRDRSLHAIDKYSDLKNVVIRTRGNRPRRGFCQRRVVLLTSVCRSRCRTASASSGVQRRKPLPVFMPSLPLSITGGLR